MISVSSVQRSQVEVSGPIKYMYIFLISITRRICFRRVPRPLERRQTGVNLYF